MVLRPVAVLLRPSRVESRYIEVRGGDKSEKYGRARENGRTSASWLHPGAVPLGTRPHYHDRRQPQSQLRANARGRDRDPAAVILRPAGVEGGEGYVYVDEA